MDSLVVGAPDKVKGQVLAAYVASADGEVDVHDLFRFLTEHKDLARFKRPKYYKVVDQLPMTATGKKKHFVATQWAQQDLENGGFQTL
jgi:acyl-coenzyme A synthetase/AMP-(fatty) acid ligase